jgi:hypothetical protein
MAPMIRLILAVAVSVFALPAATFSADEEKFARQLGDLIGSEKACGLKFDPDAIQALIAKNVSADNLDFTSRLNGDIDLAKFRARKMEGAQLRAHCFQIKRSAEALGLLSK